MDRNSLVIVILILLGGISIAYWLKYNHSNEIVNNIVQSETPLSLPERVAPETPIAPVAPPATPHSYAEALSIAKTKKMNMFIFFTADWCSHCRAMKQGALSDPAVKKELEKYVVYMLNADKEKEVVAKYKVKALPDFKIIDPNEVVLKEGTGEMNAQTFLKWLGADTDADRKLFKKK